MVLLYTLLSFATALGVAYIGTSAIIKIAHHQQVFDQPDIRKLHTHQTPSLGGIAIFAGFWIAVSLFSGIGGINYLIAATLLIAMVGIVDDILPIRAYRKLLIQLLAAGILFYAGFRLEGFYGFMGLEQVHPVLSFGMTLLFLTTLINAYNLIDGIDGLAGGFGALGALTFGILFAIMGEPAWSMLSFALAGAIVGFLKFNFYKAKIFMGDTGSTFIGLIIAVLCVQFLNMSYYTGTTQAPLIIAAIIFIPVIDLVRVFITRMSKGNSPFQPDRKHIHHIMLDTAKMSTPSICATLIALNICLILFAANYTNISLLMGLLAFTCTMMIFILLVKNIGKKEAKKRKHTTTHHTLIQMPPQRKTSA